MLSFKEDPVSENAEYFFYPMSINKDDVNPLNWLPVFRMTLLRQPWLPNFEWYK